jgi:hypothetical protein
MIQRKQTIYLGLAFICMVMLLFFPIFSIHAEGMGETVDGVFDSRGMIMSNGHSSSFPLYVIFIALALMTAAGILLYTNRKKQLLLSRLNLAFNIIIGFSMAAFYYIGKSMVEQNLTGNGLDTVSFSMDIGFFCLVASIPFLILAIRGIKHDENLLKSIDRIR